MHVLKADVSLQYMFVLSVVLCNIEYVDSPPPAAVVMHRKSVDVDRHSACDIVTVHEPVTVVMSFGVIPCIRSLALTVHSVGCVPSPKKVPKSLVKFGFFLETPQNSYKW